MATRFGATDIVNASGDPVQKVKELTNGFDQTIDFPLPGLKERSAIFQLYARQLKPEELQRLGKSSEGLSGRNIKDICEYAERRWARKLLIRKTEPSAPPASLLFSATGHLLGGRFSHEHSSCPRLSPPGVFFYLFDFFRLLAGSSYFSKVRLR